MPVDADSLHDLLDEAVRRHQVAGATLAVLDGTDVTVAATGVLHRGTGVQATPDSLFQAGSITKVWTATLLAQLVDEGRLEFRTPIAEVLPGFRVADPAVSAAVTVQHLLTHTSGIDGDVFTDTGRGGDATAAYAEVFGRLFADLCGVRVRTFAPPEDTPTLDGAAHVGTYERHGARITITPTTDGLACCSESTDELAGLDPPVEYELVPVREDLYAARDKSDGPWTPMRFHQLDGSQRYVHFRGRATPMVATD